MEARFAIASRVRQRSSAPKVANPERADEVAPLIRNHQVVVLTGETGSGKTTQLPKIALAAGTSGAG